MIYLYYQNKERNKKSDIKWMNNIGDLYQIIWFRILTTLLIAFYDKENKLIDNNNNYVNNTITANAKYDNRGRYYYGDLKSIINNFHAHSLFSISFLTVAEYGKT
ncbi:MAG TPA: hypothetical protein VE076_08970 [Nitrososphaeraceae archaeon]|nr:hypothetical protein [Nitrososphaeraceae archaeon]